MKLNSNTNVSEKVTSEANSALRVCNRISDVCISNGFWVKLVSTFFYIGCLPRAPGSAATVLGVMIAYGLRNHLVFYVSVFLVITVLGFWAAGRMEKIVGERDPSCVVIDEVTGIGIAFFMLPFSWSVVWTAFFLFRAFDMFKIYPANKLEPLPGGSGIMLDDIVAGIYTNITMQIALRLVG